MTTYSQGEVVVVDFPATSGQPGKTRPSLVVFDAGDADLILAKLITISRRSTYDVQLSDWAAAGLRAPTVVRIDKLITLENSLVKRIMGRLSPSDYQAIGKVLKSMLATW